MSTGKGYKQLVEKKIKAMHLFVHTGLNQKEVAKCVGVSEKTIGAWVKKNNWRNDALTKLSATSGLEALNDNFFAYVLKVAPDIPIRLNELLTAYKSKLMNEIEDKQKSH